MFVQQIGCADWPSRAGGSGQHGGTMRGPDCCCGHWMAPAGPAIVRVRIHIAATEAATRRDEKTIERRIAIKQAEARPEP
jgi:hypothetical protein